MKARAYPTKKELAKRLLKSKRNTVVTTLEQAENVIEVLKKYIRLSPREK